LDSHQDLLKQRLSRAGEVIRVEAGAIANLEGRLNESFSRAVDLVLGCQGQLIVTGIGKAGLVGQKISSTFASTGTPSFFLHPAEAVHGDLGRIRSHDVVLALSNSGQSPEVNAVIPPARRIGAGVIAITGRQDGALAKLADCVLDMGSVEEACPLKLAPTASTSAMLALGDALAMVVLQERDFDREDYALFHPAGALGRKLMRVREVMRTGDELPLVTAGTVVVDVIAKMSVTPGRPGAALVVDRMGKLVGIFTDGDLRRLIKDRELSRLDAPVDDTMGRDPKFVTPEQLVEEAHRILRENRVDQIPVLDAEHKPVGLLDVQDLLDVRL
jgi:arabinose-5-phosphate isomerase